MSRYLVFLMIGLGLVGCSPKRVLRHPEAASPRQGAVGREGSTTTSVASRLRPPVDRIGPGEGQELGSEVASLASAQIGRPYRWGGRTPERGFDCSGLVHWAYERVGVALPRVVREQRRVGESVGLAGLQPGDLVFFAIEGDRITHVGLYIGDGQFVHAPRSGRRVRRDSLDDPYWSERWSDSRRVAAE